MKMHTGRLVLTPQDPFYLPTRLDAILERLHEIRFRGEPVEGMNGRHYLLGERFMQLVSFLGCSPFIQLEPSHDGEPFCHLIIDGPHPQAIFLRGKNTTQPSCENCRKRIPQWQPLIDQWLAAPDTFLASCPHCGHQQNPASYNWRQSAGSGRLFLFVENIFPNEAIPSPELLRALEESDEMGGGWRFFYIQDQ
ncbi:MAG: hypothetical protein ABFR65_13810 [Pseudomonadota bacterium]